MVSGASLGASTALAPTAAAGAAGGNPLGQIAAMLAQMATQQAIASPTGQDKKQGAPSALPGTNVSGAQPTQSAFPLPQAQALAPMDIMQLLARLQQGGV